MRTEARLAAGVVGLALVGGLAGCGLTGGPELKTLTAHFDKSVGVYVHNDVRMLGVKIGEVTAIQPEGRTVKIAMTYDSQYKIPADAKAVLIAPSIVSDRYVQLTPVYDSG
ncbi:MAG: virulence factor Mce, partial [Frankiales bacterium]|nr:virulence factor Mce [Frankiales bacterium]